VQVTLRKRWKDDVGMLACVHIVNVVRRDPGSVSVSDSEGASRHRINDSRMPYSEHA
jgi:hypothetical protein